MFVSGAVKSLNQHVKDFKHTQIKCVQSRRRQLLLLYVHNKNTKYWFHYCRNRECPVTAVTSSFSLYSWFYNPFFYFTISWILHHFHQNRKRCEEDFSCTSSSSSSNIHLFSRLAPWGNLTAKTCLSNQRVDALFTCYKSFFHLLKTNADCVNSFFECSSLS